LRATPALCWDNEVVLDGRAMSWSDLSDGALEFEEPLVLGVRDTREAWSAFARGVAGRTDFALIEPERLTPPYVIELTRAGRWVRRDDEVTVPTVPSAVVPGRITVLTSGTTGPPKLVEHTLASLATLAGTDLPPRRWLCPYSAGTYAWYQLAVLGLTVPNQTIVPTGVEEPDVWVELAASARVDAVSATPTFWRRTLLHVDTATLRSLDLAQVTLGGERVDQVLLDRLREALPTARITHIYASTEAGACFAVHDGRAGFPAEWLERPLGNGVRLRVEDDRLWVSSPFAATAGAWIDTGDVARRCEDRIEIVARADESFVNVGGTKVDARAVEAVLSEHPAVLWCQVRGADSPFTGQVVVARVVADPAMSLDEAELRRFAGDRLPEAARPRIIEFVSDVPMTAAGKSVI
jgi:acyl-coenzyme A synthetase/AMP-(fatty) acid ligase